MATETITYKCGSVVLKGHLAYRGGDRHRPAVIVAHAWRGQDDFARRKAEELAGMGYVGFAADVYGDGITAKNDDEALNLMLPLFINRKLLRDRIVAAYDAIRQSSRVDPQRVGAIGFCFGGLTVIELLRSGVDIRGVVSFHGVLGNKMNDHVAETVLPAKHIPGALLVLHGHDDPLVSPEDIEALQKEMTQAGVDWEMDIYGHTMHAFTNPEANEIDKGLVFNPKVSRRAWRSMRNFFEEFLS